MNHTYKTAEVLRTRLNIILSETVMRPGCDNYEKQKYGVQRT